MEETEAEEAASATEIGSEAAIEGVEDSAVDSEAETMEGEAEGPQQGNLLHVC